MKRTPLYEYHKSHAKLTGFAGFEMPLWYVSISAEHLAVRTKVGIFDVSHMGRILLRGPDSARFLDSLMPTQAAAQPAGKSFYTLLLNERGGIRDDLIILKKDVDEYLLIVNAANTSKDNDHIKGHVRGFDVTLSDVTSQSTMIAIQGPEANDVLERASSLSLDGVKRFRFINATISGHRCTISRTGYTGEDGFEVILHDSGVDNPEFALKTWDELARLATPCGLGARDSLRIEAGLPLYGQDIDEDTNPFEAGLAWVVAKGKNDFVGGRALDQLRAEAPSRIRRGLTLTEKIPRPGFQVQAPGGEQVGRVTSGTFSPLLKQGIALGYLRAEYSEPGTLVQVRVRDSLAPARVTHPPFYDETLYGWKRTR